MAGDAMWDYASASQYGTCTVHTSEPVVDPGVDPNIPIVDPNNPMTDPNNPLLPEFPFPGGSTTQPTNPTNPGTTTQPDVPLDPLPPSDNMAG